MNKIIGLVALVGFLLSLVIHGLTFTGINIEMEQVWLLHAGGIFLCFPLFSSLHGRLGKNLTITQMRKLLPIWANALVVATFVYAFINFALFILHSEGGSPGVKDGMYVLQNHGRLIRQLSQQEYELYKVYAVRGFSGHWLFLYLLPAIYFLVGHHPKVRDVK
jgi:hypothetical protein